MDREKNIRCVVVLVEDEPVIRLVTSVAFEDADFEVHEAASAEEAVQVLQQHDGVHLVFTDVTLPGSMDGFGLAHHVSRHWPDVRIMVTSGRPRPSGRFPAGARFIAKPYRSDDILRHARELTRDGFGAQPDDDRRQVDGRGRG